jgi:superkiller protein 3
LGLNRLPTRSAAREAIRKLETFEVRDSRFALSTHNQLVKPTRIKGPHLARLTKRDIKPRLDLAAELANQADNFDDRSEFGKAIQTYKNALRHSPNQASILFNLAVAYRAAQKPALAIEIYKHLLVSAEEPDIYYGLGNAYRSLHLFEDALAAYDKAVALQADYLDASNNRALTLIDLDRPNEALTELETALKKWPEDDCLWRNRGTALQALQRFEEAQSSFQKSLNLCPYQKDLVKIADRLRRQMKA